MTRLQAEDAFFSGAAIASSNSGTEGPYVDFKNKTGDFIEWTVEVAEVGTYDLSFRYANGSTNRPLALGINGVTQQTSIDFSGTGGWSNWAIVNQSTALQAGLNTIRITATGSSGGNFDWLEVSELLPSKPVDISISNASVTEGVNDYLIFDVTLSAPSAESIVLDLEAVDSTATGGLVSDFGIDPAGDPVDYANQELEVSSDGGSTWQAANGTEVTFAPSQTALKVRLAVNDDTAAESPETLSLRVASVLAGGSSVGDFSDIGSGSIADNDTSIPVDVAISNANAIEGTNNFLVFDIALSSSSRDAVVLDLTAVDGSAKGGVISDFAVDPAGDPVDYASQEFEVSSDGGSTWRAANNGTEVTFGPGQTALKVRLAVNDDDVAEAIETLSLQVSGVLAGSVDDITDTGTGSLVDNDTDNTASVIYQAENAVLSGAVVKTGKDSTGSGYADYVNASGDFIEWTVNAESAGTYDLAWRYALGGRNSNRPLELSVNGAIALPNLGFANTGGFRRWEIVNQSVDLAAGANTIRLTAIGSSGANFDYLEVSNPSALDNICSPISLLPCTDVRVEGDLVFDFDGAEVGLTDKDGEGLGFTMVDPSSNPSNPAPQAGVVGYLPSNLDIDEGKLKITTTSGIQIVGSNSLDNALGVGLNVPSRSVRLETTLVDLPEPVGGFAQAGLWFGRAEGGGAGTSEDDYVKIALVSDTAGRYVLETLLEEDGVIIQSQKALVPNGLASIDLAISINPFTQTVITEYDTGEGFSTLSVLSGLPLDWFSFDQAGLVPEIATRSFGGIFATDRKAATPQVFSFEDFSITEDTVPEPDTLFDRWSVPVNNPTAMAVGPDGRLYVATLFGTIHAFTLDAETRTFVDEVITTLPDAEGPRLTLGLAVDPDSTATDVRLWVAHSDGAVNDGALNSGKISVLSGLGFTQKEDVITGLPRAIANHATNNIDFGPDGKLYIWQGGNTGAGSANTEVTEFGDRPEQVFSAAALVADIPQWKLDPVNFEGDVSSPIGEFIDEFYARKETELGRPFTELQVYASGLRNTYDGVFHSNGSLYAPGNGLGVKGTTVPVPRLGDPSDRSVTTRFGENPVDNPGPQGDPLNRIVEGGYYGHPNPYRDEVVFQDGSFQGLNPASIPGHPAYTPPLLNLGLNKSANGIIEYTADNFFGQLKGDLLITNFSQGDDITRVELSDDGLIVEDSAAPLIVGFEDPAPSESLIGGFLDPLPILMGPDGSIFVGEFNGGKVTILESIGTWRKDLPSVPAPLAILDAGSTTLDGKLYMVGGKTQNAHVSSVYVYDPGDSIDATDDIWSAAPNLPGVAVENPAVVSLDGQIYAFGGSTGPFSGAVSNAAVFDPLTSSWMALADMPTARGGATAQVVDGNIYVIGGLAEDGSSLSTVEIFDPVTGQWAGGSSLQTARDNPGSAVIDDLLYVFGGRTRNVSDTLASLEIYNPTTDTWSFGNDMLTARRTMVVGTIDGRIQVTGGEGGGETFAAHEEYNPVTGRWKPLSSISTPRHGAAYGTIDDVTYVAGGGPTAGSSFTNLVEAFTL
ncbi:MAG: kelch repeat-containing protein [Phormidesmis sp.]